MNSASELNREGSQLWNPTSQQLTDHAAELKSHSRHLNNFPPSRHCTEQFTGPAGPNTGVMIDFTAETENVRQQIEESEQQLELVSHAKGFEDHDEVEAEPPVERQVHNPYSVNRVYLKVDPNTARPIDARQQSDYFPEVQKQRQTVAPPIPVAFNDAGIIFMPPRPPNIESFDVFVKGGDDQAYADSVMTNMIYRWYSLCSVNVTTYWNWFVSRVGSLGDGSNLVGVPPPNPADFTDLAEWYFIAVEWWEANFNSHQSLRFHSRSAAAAAASGNSQNVAPASAPRNISPSKRATAVPHGSNVRNPNAPQPSFSPSATSHATTNTGGRQPPQAVGDGRGK